MVVRVGQRAASDRERSGRARGAILGFSHEAVRPRLVGAALADGELRLRLRRWVTVRLKAHEEILDGQLVPAAC